MRRSFLHAAAGSAALCGLLAWSAAPADAHSRDDEHAGRGHFKNLVVIYEENHSFDNLYGGWGSVDDQQVAGIGTRAYQAKSTQVDQAGNPINCLYQDDANLGTKTQMFNWLDGTSHPGHRDPACTGTLPNGATAYDSAFTSSKPFSINRYLRPTDTSCAPGTAFAPNGVLARTQDPVNGDPQGLPGGCTRDLVHRFYQEQYQLDGGRQDRYPTGSDAAGLTQGYYNTKSLPIYRFLHSEDAPNYVIADHFFQAAFGGSFLNHQYLVAARAPVWPAPPAGKNSQLDAAGFPNASYPLYAPQPGVTYNDGPLTQACPANPKLDSSGFPVDANGRACGNYAVNTVQPTNLPHGSGNVLPLINDTDPNAANYETNIGDELSAKNVSWAWFAGGWNDANAGHPDPLFQYHHQPLNYFANYAPGQPGRAHLKDEIDFTAAAKAGTLPSVSFVKPVGSENEHPGYSSVHNGESHLVDLIKTIESGPQAKNTLIVVTYDEFGGQWDHVAPPGQGNNAGPHDSYGPGTRVPALLIGRPLHESGVDSTSYDTTSILATIEHKWKLAPLTARDKRVNTLMHAFKLEDEDDD
jgi:acid phosphatase